MHPPPWNPNHWLSDWPNCHFELECCGTVVMPVRLLAEQCGDQVFSHVLPRLRCSKCGRAPAPVYLCAGHRERRGGAPADWAIELVPPRKR